MVLSPGANTRKKTVPVIEVLMVVEETEYKRSHQ
jgi:hypothetical protein